MKAIGIAVLLLISSAAYAQTNTRVSASPAPGAVLQVGTPNDGTSRLDVELGAVRLNTHSGRYTVAYLPFLAPLPGTAFRSSMEMPNAFALTGMTIPQRPARTDRGLVDIR